MEAVEIRVGGRPVRLWSGGKGPPLLLLHGGVTDAETHWAPIWNLLAERFTVHAPDWPGFGGSAWMPRPTYPRLVAWLDNLRLTLKLGTLHVAGNSFGGTLGRLYAAEHPSNVESLALLNGGGFIPRLPLRARLILASPFGALTMARRARGGMGDAALTRMIAEPDRFDPALRARFAASGEIFPVLRHCLTGPAPRADWARVPTLILWGEGDRHVPLAAAQALSTEVPHARLRIVPAAGHFPQIEQPRVVADALFELAGIGPRVAET
jgi:magnesium chelatase accessory protein